MVREPILDSCDGLGFEFRSMADLGNGVNDPGYFGEGRCAGYGGQGLSGAGVGSGNGL